jgi:hypothetical protein
MGGLTRVQGLFEHGPSSPGACAGHGCFRRGRPSGSAAGQHAGAEVVEEGRPSSCSTLSAASFRWASASSRSRRRHPARPTSSSNLTVAAGRAARLADGGDLVPAIDSTFPLDHAGSVRACRSPWEAGQGGLRCRGPAERARLQALLDCSALRPSCACFQISSFYDQGSPRTAVCLTTDARRPKCDSTLATV